MGQQDGLFAKGCWAGTNAALGKHQPSLEEDCSVGRRCNWDSCPPLLEQAGERFSWGPCLSVWAGKPHTTFISRRKSQE